MKAQDDAVLMEAGYLVFDDDLGPLFSTINRCTPDLFSVYEIHDVLITPTEVHSRGWCYLAVVDWGFIDNEHEMV